MEYIKRLTEQQQKVFDVMLHMARVRQSYLLSSEDRGIGKSITLNELAFTLQTIGYDVYLLNPHPVKDYYVNNIIALDSKSYEGLFRENSVVIADESRYEMMDDILEYCKYKKVPIVGYVNFETSL
jgi:hypothetical protein